MSFSFNPFKHIEIVEEDSDDDMWTAYCHGCGAILKSHGSTEPFSTFLANMEAHLKSSHGKEPRDYEKWSII